jgi:hypothetical protein
VDSTFSLAHLENTLMKPITSRVLLLKACNKLKKTAKTTKAVTALWFVSCVQMKTWAK